MQVTAVIIARGGSKRLPNKNIKDFHGRPLVGHKVWQLTQCERIDKVIVGSDDDAILAAAASEGAITIKRLPEYCDEKTRSWNEVIANMCEQVSGDLIVWAHCTNPLISPKTYDKAVEAFVNSDKDSLISVTRVQSHLWRGGSPFNFNPKAARHAVAAELEPVFYQNGGIFIAKRQDMIKWKYVYNNPVLFELSDIESVDIDEPSDFAIAEVLYGRW